MGTLNSICRSDSPSAALPKPRGLPRLSGRGRQNRVQRVYSLGFYFSASVPMYFFKSIVLPEFGPWRRRYFFFLFILRKKYKPPACPKQDKGQSLAANVHPERRHWGLRAVLLAWVNLTGPGRGDIPWKLQDLWSFCKPEKIPATCVCYTF